MLMTGEIVFPFGYRMNHTRKVIEINYRPYGHFISLCNASPILYSCEYMVQYPDGTEETLIYAKVVENLYILVGDTRNQIHIYAGIVGYWKRILQWIRSTSYIKMIENVVRGVPWCVGISRWSGRVVPPHICLQTSFKITPP